MVRQIKLFWKLARKKSRTQWFKLTVHFGISNWRRNNFNYIVYLYGWFVSISRYSQVTSQLASAKNHSLLTSQLASAKNYFDLGQNEQLNYITWSIYHNHTNYITYDRNRPKMVTNSYDYPSTLFLLIGHCSTKIATARAHNWNHSSTTFLIFHSYFLAFFHHAFYFVLVPICRLVHYWTRSCNETSKEEHIKKPQKFFIRKPTLSKSKTCHSTMQNY